MAVNVDTPRANIVSPSASVEKVSSDEQDTHCPICHEDYSLQELETLKKFKSGEQGEGILLPKNSLGSENGLFASPCGHALHQTCAAQNLEYRSTCCLCRKEIPTKQQHIANPALRTTQALNVVEGALQVATIVCAILCLIPPLRFAGSLALRSISFIWSCKLCKGDSQNAQNASLLEKASRCSKVALVALGIVGTALSTPILIVISLACDSFLQLIALVQTLCFQDLNSDQACLKALMHFGMIVVNTLVITAIVFGAWPLIVAASAVSAALMFAAAVYGTITQRVSLSSILLFAYYVALIGIGIAGAISMCEMSKDIPKEGTFNIKNDTDYPQDVYDNQRVHVATIEPHHSMQVTVSYDRLIGAEYNGNGTLIHDGSLRVVTTGSWDVNTGAFSVPTAYPHPDTTTYEHIVLHAPIAAQSIPNTPFGSTAVIVKT